MKLLRIIALCLVMILMLTACWSSRTCSSCDRSFRGNAYRGVYETTVMRRACAEEYWYMFNNIDHLRIR